MNGGQIEATNRAIAELEAHTEAAEARCARLEGIVQRVVNCRESMHLPALLILNARVVLSDTAQQEMRPNHCPTCGSFPFPLNSDQEGTDNDEPRDAIREIDGPDGWSDPDEGAR